MSEDAANRQMDVVSIESDARAGSGLPDDLRFRGGACACRVPSGRTTLSWPVAVLVASALARVARRRRPRVK